VKGSSESPVLAGHHVTVRFGSGDRTLTAVDSACVEVGAGQTIGIVGESGSGKTSLARVLAGLLRPAAGEVLLDGRPVFGPGIADAYPRAERGQVQMVFQDPYSSLDPRQRAGAAVAEAIQVWHGVRGQQAHREAVALLAALGVGEEHARRYPSALSGGQRQRVSVARALAPRPRVLIADEPTSAIDQSAQAQLLNILRRLQRERDLAVVFISHDLGIMRYLSSRVYVMQHGRIVESGDTACVFTRPSHAYTRLLLDSIPGRPAPARSSQHLEV
jgi:ABC-type dipeptide/oligopeptide/nickel transport system ATPase subunit